ncbi:hypothetical protein L202_01356 [Cryptococcus amylolentus CBS 6039]|uniref:Uncharacterized protein n=1 Tax=Cryptococcus amylolentus CBS 6039 TaxID=1295533 RepID=A0A1E3I3M7_9TREE|nr:hypothetical protein L202_01356 [Cryptococcus amylolentus CBS 6039]ODN83159.1 hypothetical protein L202_01356 [Cryptococcus amylolentus CBS 6039]
MAINKRKRRASQDTSIKVVIPAPGASLRDSKRAKLAVAEEDGEGEDEDAEGELDVGASEDAHGSDAEQEDAPAGTPLSQQVRQGLSSVIAEMGKTLPSPLDKVLTIWLPPTFAKKKENTLGHLLQQPSLTWETLVDTIHRFSENLLVPVQYPNPVPARASFNIPPPPLPQRYPPHAIYSFCASLYDILLNVQPAASGGKFDAERWALVQKTTQGGEWFSGAVDVQEASKLVRREGHSSLVDALIGESRLGHTSVVSLHAALGSSSAKVQKLGDSVIRRASLKVDKWKQMKKLRNGSFGSIATGVTIPAVGSKSFTPTFGFTYDSSSATASQGYFSTVEAMHERARHNEWAKRALAHAKEIEEGGWQGIVKEGSEEKATGKLSVEEILTENGELIEELQAWQEVRIHRGVQEPTEREELIANELLSSLSRLAGHVPPADLVPTHAGKIGWSHDAAKRHLSTPSPSIRGTLDPRRPHALHDNTTIRLRTGSVKPASGNGASAGPSASILTNGTPTPPVQSTPLHNSAPSYALPPTAKVNVMPPPPSPQYQSAPPHLLALNSPHNLPPTVGYPPNRSPAPYRPPPPHTPQPQRSPYPQYTSPLPTAPPVMHARGIPPPMPNMPNMPNMVNYMRPGPGPSNLRQSVGHMAGGAPMGVPPHMMYGQPPSNGYM